MGKSKFILCTSQSIERRNNVSTEHFEVDGKNLNFSGWAQKSFIQSGFRFINFDANAHVACVDRRGYCFHQHCGSLCRVPASGYFLDLLILSIKIARLESFCGDNALNFDEIEI